jgi:hypothetical protein
VNFGEDLSKMNIRTGHGLQFNNPNPTDGPPATLYQTLISAGVWTAFTFFKNFILFNYVILKINF